MTPLVFLLMLACSESPHTDVGDSNVVLVEVDDPELLAAEHRAALTLPTFVSRLTQPPPTQTLIALKGRFEQQGTTEHLWLTRVEVHGDGFTGLIDNDPQHLTHLSAGQEVTLTTDQVSDWMAVDDGVLVGGTTLRALRARMSPADRRQLDKVSGFAIH